MKQNLLFFFLLIFVFLTGILSATVYFNRQKIFEKEETKVSQEKKIEESQPAPSASKEETSKKETPTVEVVSPNTSEFANWVSYQNNRFKYRLKYDPNWLKGRDCDTGDSCFFQGDISTKGWPDISIGKRYFSAIEDIDALKNHLAETYSGAEVKKVVFSRYEIPAVYLSSGRSPQSYAHEEYYFFHKGEILAITLNDSDNSTAQKIYHYFLSNFELLND
ncbi:MAG: hypothetical protein QHH09_01265 [Microgenomates group bacterium]|jgi:hypothetical protein|nr:hypothetical protein [Microgenomates group bacterium]